MTRIAVVGLGRMGRHHVRVLGQLADVELVGAVDPRHEARGAVSGVRVYPASGFTGVGEPNTFQDLNPYNSVVLTDGVFVG